MRLKEFLLLALRNSVAYRLSHPRADDPPAMSNTTARQTSAAAPARLGGVWRLLRGS